MPTVAEVLRESGFTDQQIGEMDQRAITAFSNVLSTAQQTRDAAELAQRSNVDFYENRIVPSLVGWDAEKQRLENDSAQRAAEAAFYRTQAEEARKVGFIPADAPSFPGRDGQGRYIANAPGGTPGSPQFFDVNKVYERAGDAVGTLSDIQWEHQKLFNQPLPLSPSELVKRADALHLDPRAYAERELGWTARRAELQKQEMEAHDLKVASDAIAANDKKWAERVGSNPDVRMSQTSPRMTEVQRAVRNKELPDPLLLNDQQRRQATAQMIRKDMAEEANR